jgi:hypothetical protein
MSSEKINSVQKNGDTACGSALRWFISVVPTKPTGTVFKGIALADASLTTNERSGLHYALSRSFEDLLIDFDSPMASDPTF